MPARDRLAFATQAALQAALSRTTPRHLLTSFVSRGPLHRRVHLVASTAHPRRARALQRLSTVAQSAGAGTADAANTPAVADADAAASVGYDFASFERKWQSRWLERGDFTVAQPPELDTSKPKYYVLDMFPYPSGSGLHVGHPEGYTATDILARYHRMRGYNVMHPMGWDAFGLPAEQFALATGTHPAITTENNIARFREQLQALGFSYDWNREVRTSDPGYYRWTQWIFLQLWKRGLAYQDDKPVNWCPALGTVLANEEVIDGLSERGGHPVERRQMRQWVLRITAYAERLLDDLHDVDWPDNVKEMQRNWIGKSEGAELTFKPVDLPTADEIVVFTTRPETICGVSYVVVGPEWPGLSGLVTPDRKAEVETYVEAAARKSDRERGDGGKQKTGVWTGSYARNPVNGTDVPVWVGDYVLGGYGTGAVMAVPAHDERDYAFAQTFDLPIVQVIAGDVSQGALTDDAEMCAWNGAAGLELDGLLASEARARLLDHLEKSGLGTRRVNYKLRDWLFSRQRYWGEPFPIVFVDGEAQAVDESDLPVTLPEVESYKPSGTGDSPLAGVADWVQTTHGADGASALRETNTMPQWAGSCWYYLRFLDPDNVGRPIDPAVERYWMPVDVYVGGVEHAVLHLLYARFWHKVLYDVGVVSTKEPFQRLVNQGMILGEVEHTAFRDDSGMHVSANDVDIASCTRLSDGSRVSTEHVAADAVKKSGDHMELVDAPGIRVSSRAHKMSKSRGNVVNPDAVIAQYGADALRCYLMFMGPLEQVKPWGTKGVQGMSRFLARFWRLVVDPTTDGLCAAASETQKQATKAQMRTLHQTIRRVTDDVEALRFNTAIAGLMEFVNAATKWETRPQETLLPAVRMLSLFAPHMAEELWERLGQTSVLSHEQWPEWTDRYDGEESKLIVVQVNGKVRSKMQVPSSATKDEILERALGEDGVVKHTSGMTIRKQIYVPDKLVNLVVSK